MEAYPQEHHVAALLRELIAQSGMSPAALEERLAWEPGRLTAFLDGQQRLSFDAVLEILPLLATTPVEFLARLYEAAPPAASTSAKQRAMERLFERSLRAVRNAVARRAARKRQRSEGD